jgi:hypothetical protein
MIKKSLETAIDNYLKIAILEHERLKTAPHNMIMSINQQMLDAGTKALIFKLALDRKLYDNPADVPDEPLRSAVIY